MPFPSTLTSFSYPQATDRLNNPSHSGVERAQSSAIGQIEVVLGTSTTSVLGTIIGDLRNPSSGGGGHVQTANKGGTGQTTYTKGDVLVAQSSSVLTKLAVGSDGSTLIADSTQAVGAKWGSTGNGPTGTGPIVRVYSSSVVSIWTKPSVISYAIIETVGGGGGGGASGTTNGRGGSGGGGGGYARKIVTAALLPSAASIITGVGGAGGAAGSNNGVVGGISYFGSVISATGGGAGNYGSSNTGSGGVGGIGVGGDFNIKGQGGGPLDGSGVSSGTGGSSHLGGGAEGVNNSNDLAGSAGGQYGGGGSGGIRLTGDAAGGVGADGVIIIYEY